MRRRRKNLGTMSWVGIGAGVLGIGGLVWWIIARKRAADAALLATEPPGYQPPAGGDSNPMPDTATLNRLKQEMYRPFSDPVYDTAITGCRTDWLGWRDLTDPGLKRRLRDMGANRLSDARSWATINDLRQALAVRAYRWKCDAGGA